MLMLTEVKKPNGARTIVVKGRWLKTASIFDEDWLQEDLVGDPEQLCRELRTHAQRPDIFSFAEKLPRTTPRYPYKMVWDNVAVIAVGDVKKWWEEKLPQETRKNVRRAAKRGVVVRSEVLTDALAAGIKAIYDEIPMRQGRPFWHYGKPLERVREENSSYLERSEFVCAYFEEELIGFLKLVYTGESAFILQIVAKEAHRDKRPMNAIIARAVETCAERGVGFLVYGQYVYGRNTDSPLTEFKRRNGFEPVLLPRYFIPLTLKGRIALLLGLEQGWRRFLPQEIDRILRRLRTHLYSRRFTATRVMKAGALVVAKG